MQVRTHYDVLDVAQDASATTIRAAYRRLAREHHPDRAISSSAAGGPDMSAVNEAYRVLNDSGRRALYDRTLNGNTTVAPSPADDPAVWDAAQLVRHRNDGPARVPWRMLLLSGSIAIVGIVALAQFTEPGEPLGPDGILRNGDCVEILPNSDAREIACVGLDDLVVRAFVPFDGTCPGQTEPHRDRQGMGVACVQLAPTPADG